MVIKQKGNQKQIFIIDDDAAIRDILTAILEGEQYSTEAFPSGISALKKLEAKRPDLILLDYYLPGENAEEVVYALRKTTGENLPIVLMSAYSQGSDVVKRLALKEFLAKPFQLETVLQAVRKYL